MICIQGLPNSTIAETIYPRIIQDVLQHDGGNIMLGQMCGCHIGRPEGERSTEGPDPDAHNSVYVHSAHQIASPRFQWNPVTFLYAICKF